MDPGKRSLSRLVSIRSSDDDSYKDDHAGLLSPQGLLDVLSRPWRVFLLNQEQLSCRQQCTVQNGQSDHGGR